MNHKQVSGKVWIGRVIKAGATSVAGWGLASLMARPASATLWPQYHTGIYTFNGPDCSAGGEVDPINVVFYFNYGHGSNAADAAKSLAGE